MLYKMIMMDLDGTALQNDRIHLSNRLLEALNMAHDMGVHIVPTTGRQYSNLPPIFFEGLKWKKYCILCSGAEIRNFSDDSVKSSYYLNKKDLKEILRIADKYNAPMEISAAGRAIVTKESIKWLKANGGKAMNFHLNVTLPEIGMVVEDLYEYISKNDLNILNVFCAFVPIKVREKMFKELSDLSYHCVWGSKNGIEITNLEATKAKSMERVCKILGVSTDECIAIGDSGNDISMLKKAGLGIAVKNASDEVKKEADYVALRNDEDGVAEAIERFVIKKINKGR